MIDMSFCYLSFCKLLSLGQCKAMSIILLVRNRSVAVPLFIRGGAFERVIELSVTCLRCPQSYGF